MEADMKALLGILKFAVIGFALLAGGRTLYRNRNRLGGDWMRFSGVKGQRGIGRRLSVSNLLRSAGPVRNLAGQFSRVK
jgi:hypothetical protein